MVIVKVIRHSGSGIDYLRNMVNNVTDYRTIATGGSGVDYTNPQIAFKQMLLVKRHYNQTSMNPLIHFVISLDGTCDNEYFARKAAPAIAAYFKDQFQLLWCVHCNDNEDAHYHIHILLHSVNVMNGKLFHSGPFEVNRFAYYIKEITGINLLKSAY